MVKGRPGWMPGVPARSSRWAGRSYRTLLNHSPSRESLASLLREEVPPCPLLSQPLCRCKHPRGCSAYWIKMPARAKLLSAKFISPYSSSPTQFMLGLHKHFHWPEESENSGTGARGQGEGPPLPTAVPDQACVNAQGTTEGEQQDTICPPCLGHTRTWQEAAPWFLPAAPLTQRPKAFTGVAVEEVGYPRASSFHRLLAPPRPEHNRQKHFPCAHKYICHLLLLISQEGSEISGLKLTSYFSFSACPTHRLSQGKHRATGCRHPTQHGHT